MRAVPVVLGFRPNSHGFAWIAFSSPLAIHDWGIIEVRTDKNEGCLAKLEKLFARLVPHTFVLEAPSGKRASPRTISLCMGAAALARAQGIDVTSLSRNDVRACFASVGARTRWEIAAAIARSFEMLRDLLPERRRVWEGPHRRMALFEAAAVVLTHYQLGASQLFDDLWRDANNASQDSEE